MTSGATQPIAETLQSDSKEEDNVSHTASLAANSSIFENNGDHRRCKSDVGTISQIKKMLAGTDQNYEQDTLNLEAPKALVEIIDVQMVCFLVKNKFYSFNLDPSASKRVPKIFERIPRYLASRIDAYAWRKIRLACKFQAVKWIAGENCSFLGSGKCSKNMKY